MFADGTNQVTGGGLLGSLPLCEQLRDPFLSSKHRNVGSGQREGREGSKSGLDPGLPKGQGSCCQGCCADTAGQSWRGQLGQERAPTGLSTSSAPKSWHPSEPRFPLLRNGGASGSPAGVPGTGHLPGTGHPGLGSAGCCLDTWVPASPMNRRPGRDSPRQVNPSGRLALPP